MHITTILFDLDNTLIDRDRALRTCLETRARQGDLPLGEDPAPAVAEIMRRDASGQSDRERFGGWLATRFPALGSDGGEVWKQIRQALPGFLQPDPAVLALLEKLGRRHGLALVSNGGSETQRSKLKQAGLEDHFDRVFISAEVGVEKPEPVFFELVFSAMGCTPAEVLVVGDDPLLDIVPAARLGCATCWVARGDGFPATGYLPTYVVQSPVEVAEILSC